VKKSYFLITFLLFINFFSQTRRRENFHDLKKIYSQYSEHDTRAIPAINELISVAKAHRNHTELTHLFQAANFYSTSPKQKLIYADSTIASAIISNKNALISNAYLEKGIIHFLYYRNYKPALLLYLKADQYATGTNDEFLKHKISYYLGAVKDHLGYNEDALLHFQKANLFFKKQIDEHSQPSIMDDYRKGYYNSIHRMIVCHRKLKDYKTADSLNNIGLLQTHNDSKNRTEYGYFLKELGISEYQKGNYSCATTLLQNSSELLRGSQDFAWETVNLFFIGKCYLASNNIPLAIKYFQKVDSSFQKHNFIIPELRENYELLITHFNREKKTSEELYYNRQLIKVDRVITKDFTFLASFLHKNYDLKKLQNEKKQLTEVTFFGILIIFGLSVIAILLIILFLKKFRSERNIRVNYQILEQKIINNAYALSTQKEIPTEKQEKCGPDQKTVEDIITKLKHFEDNYEFTEYGLTIHKLAHRFETNSAYLSQIINQAKGNNFNRYLGELRIKYITNKLYSDKVFLSYKIETLAKHCGIASRTNFSNLFQEINGMRPTDFIQKRQSDLKSESETNG